MDVLSDAIDRMFTDLDEFLAARPLNRLSLVHGYELVDVTVAREPNPFAPSITRERAKVSLRLPIVWEPTPGSIPARASDTPTTAEPDRLHAMLHEYVKAGGLRSAGVVELTDWQLSRPDGEVPSRGSAHDAYWTVEATFVAH